MGGQAHQLPGTDQLVVKWCGYYTKNMVSWNDLSMFSTAILVYKFFPFSEFVLKVGVLASVYAGSALSPSEFFMVRLYIRQGFPVASRSHNLGFASAMKDGFRL